MNKSIRVAIPLTLTLLVLLGLFACTQGPAPSNQSNQRAANTGLQSTETPGILLPPPPCDPSKPAADRARDLNNHLNQHGLGDVDLEKQRGPGKAFLVEFVAQGNEVVMKVRGRIAGGSPSNGADAKPKMKHLLDAVDKYMKRECAERATFEGLTTTSFEYEACPFPSQPCPDGSCACPPADGSIPRTNGNSANGNSSSNSNTGSNNSNSNTRTNSNSNTSP